MPVSRRFQAISVTASCAAATAAVLWGIALAAIWHHLSRPALSDDQMGAMTSTLAAVILWSVRWLGRVLAGAVGGSGIAYLIDVMLNQRAWYRRRLRTATGPLRLPSPRHAR
jgi:hypothetical protein